jgi:hypothetical protein
MVFRSSLLNLPYVPASTGVDSSEIHPGSGNRAVCTDPRRISGD